MKHAVKKSTQLFVALSFAFAATSVSAQDGFSTGADLVSSYVWRGVEQGSNEPNIQPYASYTLGNFTIGAWGSGNFSSTLKELDLYATYAFSSNLAVTISDYNWSFTKSYFNYAKSTDHIFEATVAYTGGESLPISASINTMFAGNDKKTNGDRAYSTYMEVGYQLTPNAKVFCGASVFKSPDGIYNTSGFDFTNIGIKVTKSIAFTDKFSLPVYSVAGVNPSAQSAFLVAGLSL